jgi:hypothetical protein
MIVEVFELEVAMAKKAAERRSRRKPIQQGLSKTPAFVAIIIL